MKETKISDKFAARFGMGCLIILAFIVVTVCFIAIFHIIRLWQS